MKYGEKDGAIGYLVGEENRGLNVMFIMMNAARLAVGTQGVSVAERATQQAIAYAKDRRQGRTASSKGGEMGPIIEHADIRRTLMTMKALTQAARAICLVTAKETDVARRAKDPAQRAAAANRVALLTPIAKAFSTDIGCEVASMGVQVHGGMGFIEETGAAQIYRDARILPIYEGTNGIQAIDLVARKLPLEGGKVVAGYIAELTQDRRRGARLQPARVRPHGRAAGRGGGRAGGGVALDGRRPAEEPGCGDGWRDAVSAAVRAGVGRHLSRARGAWRRRATGDRRSRSPSRASLPRTSPAPRRG